MNELESLRQEIDNIDKELTLLFEKRMEVVFKIAKYKETKGWEIIDNSREREIILQNTEYLNNKDLKLPLEEFLSNIMKISKDLQDDYRKNI